MFNILFIFVPFDSRSTWTWGASWLIQGPILPPPPPHFLVARPLKRELFFGYPKGKKICRIPEYNKFLHSPIHFLSFSRSFCDTNFSISYDICILVNLLYTTTLLTLSLYHTHSLSPSFCLSISLSVSLSLAVYLYLSHTHPLVLTFLQIRPDRLVDLLDTTSRLTLSLRHIHSLPLYLSHTYTTLILTFLQTRQDRLVNHQDSTPRRSHYKYILEQVF